MPGTQGEARPSEPLLVPQEIWPTTRLQQLLASAAVKRGGRPEWSHHLGSVGREDCRSHRTCGLGQSTLVAARAIDKRVPPPATHSRCRYKERPIGSLLAGATLTPVGRAGALHPHKLHRASPGLQPRRPHAINATESAPATLFHFFPQTCDSAKDLQEASMPTSFSRHPPRS